MSLTVEKFDVEGPLLIHGERHHDTRGHFSEVYKESAFADLGLPHFVQDNLSLSKKGVFRGMHWQLPPYEQGKLVTCLTGKILDFFIDLRVLSPTFGEVRKIELSSARATHLWVPSGFAHGFESLEDNTLVLYKVTNPWVPDSERSCKLPPVLLSSLEGNLFSPKDAKAPEIQSLPTADLFHLQG